MSIKHHNFDYAAGPTFPEAVGDRYYCQDLARDYWSKIDDAGKKVAAGFTAFPVLLKDSNMTKGTNWDDLDIPAAKGIVEFEVDVPLSYAALPPTVTQEDIYVRIETSAETDFDISGATLDGVTTNYVKVTYNETNGSSRTRAKKAGTYVYEKAISYTITVTPAAPTNKDLVLGTVVGDGATFLTIVSYPRTRRYGDEYDYVISSQDEFDIIIDRTAANQYRIKDNIKSIFVKYLAGGYQMTGATSPLFAGDTWGYIETNDCTRIVFEPGAFIDMHQNIGYIEVDTDYCYLDGVSVQGDKGAASAITRSFLLNANYVTFANCEAKTRLSNAIGSGFEGSGTAIHNKNSRYIGCIVTDYDSSANQYAFYLCHNLDNSYVYDIAGTGTNMYLFYQCYNINNTEIDKIDHSGGTVCAAFYQSENINNAIISDFDSDANLRPVTSCYNCSNITVSDIQSSASAVGFMECKRITNCKVIQIDVTAGASNCAAFYDCENISNCYAEDIDQTGTGAAYGFRLCDRLTCCEAQDIDSTASNYHGFFECNELSSCFARTCEDGFNTCKQVTGCQAESNSNDGFFSCNRVSGSFATGNGNDGFEDCNVLSANAANSNTGNGFDGCVNMTANRATGNTAANYNNSFADFGGTQACADTAVGGYNS